VAGIAQIKRDFIVGPLSNGNTALLVDMAKAAGLAWDVILGSDVSQAYKPDPDAYLKPAAMLGLKPGEVMLGAAHNGDLAAAREVGLATGFIVRPLERGPGQKADLTPAADWDVTATSIIDLARQLS
jgi:2-haloacid dehalogenase